MKRALHGLLWVVEFLIGLSLIIAVLLLLLPWLLRIDGIRGAVCKLLKGPLKAEIAIEKLEIGWWSPTDVEGLTYKTLDGRQVLCCKRIATPASLWNILLGTHDLKTLTVESPTIGLLFQSNIKKEPVSLQAAGIPEFQVDLAKMWKKLTPSVSGQIALSDGLILVQGKDIQDIRIENLTLQATLPKKSDYLKFSLSGETRQGEQKGTLDFSGNFGPLDSPEPVLSAEGNLSKLPIFAVDQCVALFYPRFEGIIYAGIGPTLDLKAKGKLSNKRFDLSFSASSAQFNADLSIVTQEGKITLVAPARFGLTLTAFLADEFFSLSPYLMGMQLASSPRVTLDISQLTIPLDEQGIAWKNLSLKGEINLLALEVSTPALFQGIALERFKAVLSTENLAQRVFFDSKADLSFGDKRASLTASGELSEAFAEVPPVTYAVSTQNFPVAILDQVMDTSGFLQDAIGESCDFNSAIEKTAEGRSLTLYFNSPHIAMTDAHFHLLDDGLILKEPLHFSFSPPETFWTKHANGMGITPADVLLEELDYKFGTLSSIRSKGSAKSEKLFYRQFSLDAPTFDFNIETFYAMTLALQSEGIKTKVKMGYDKKKKTLALLEPFEFSLNLSQEKTDQFWKELCLTPPFQSALVFHSSIRPFTMAIGQNFLRGTTLEGTAEMPSLVAKSSKGSTAFLCDAKMHWTLDADAGKLFGRIDAGAGSDEASLTPLHAELLLQNVRFQPTINFEELQSTVRIAFEKLDPRFFDAFGGDFCFSPIFGAWISAKGEVSFKPSYSLFKVDATCEKGSVTAALVKEGNTIDLFGKQPVQINLSLDSQGLDCLGKALPIGLQQPCLLDLRINRLHLPLEPEHFQELAIDASLQSELLSFMEKPTQKPISLHHLALSLARLDPQSPFLIRAKASIDGAKMGQIDVKSAVSGISYGANGWDFAKVQANIDANFQQLPTSLLDTITTIAGAESGLLPTLFGEQISGSLDATIQEKSGPIALSINSPSTRISLDGKLDNGLLLLNQPFFAQLTMTEGISRLFLKGVNPLSISAVRSEGPMTLNVEKEGFALPLLPWNVEQINVPRMRIEVGKITCRNQGNIQTALGLLKLGQFSKSNDLTLWFAPMDLSIAKGIIDCERTEILVADSIEIATWGTVSLPKNWVDAVLGLTAQALSKSFGIKGLPETYVLQIPMKGPIDDVKIDTGKATAKIALLLAGQNASSAGGLIGGQAGELVGGILGQLSKLPDANSKAPPPKHPFPWEQAGSSPSQLPAKKRKNAIKPTDKPLKKLLKLLK